MIISAAVNMIAVKPIKMSEVSQGGVFEIASDKQPEIGQVASIGPRGKKEMPFSDLVIGDKVLYRKYGSTNFIVGGAEYAFIGYDDIVGRIK